MSVEIAITDDCVPNSGTYVNEIFILLGPLYGAERSFDANILGYLAGTILVCQIIQEECQVLRWVSGYIRTGEDGDW